MERQRSAWRTLFAEDGWPNSDGWPLCLEPLRDVFAEMPADAAPEQMKRWQPRLAQALRSLQLPAGLVSQLISDHNDWLYRRAIRHALAEMQLHGWGEPPCGFCVLTLGSGARHESLLRPDQDNAMIIDDYDEGDHQAVDTWFQSLGERFTDYLDRAGIPLCNGHVMARWPLWRKPLSQWCTQMTLWTGRRTVKRVQYSNILLDFAPVYGDALLAQRFRAHVLELMPRAGLFLHEMSELMDETPVALDRFDRLKADDQDAPHARALNLKRQGLLPLQGALRLLALRNGVAEVDCRSRLQVLCAQRVLSEDQAQGLTQALELMQTLLLDAQLQALAAGRQADNWLDLGQMGEWTRQQLRQALLQVRDLQRKARIRA